MTKQRKRFFIGKSLAEGMSDTIRATENHAGNARFEVISLRRIEPDPLNPRDLKLLPHDIYNGIDASDLDYIQKNQELESLKSLSDTIKQKGLINPVVVYKYGENYRLVAGERRFLASILAKKDDIQARILNERPRGLALRLLQWIENTERQDLSLRDRVGNVKSILDEYKKENKDIEINSSTIKELINISSSQAACYLSILKAPQDVVDGIESGKINNIDKAAFISNIKDGEVRKKAIESCLAGDGLAKIKNVVDEANGITPIQRETFQKRQNGPGRAFKSVNLGKTEKIHVVKKIIHSVLQTTPKFKPFEARLSDVDWGRYDDTTKVFRDFLNLLEKESEH